MKYFVPVLYFFGTILISNSVLAQRGPGGVTYDTDNQKNCRLWLDAGDLTGLADGDNVITWYDKSISDVQDSAFWNSDNSDLYLSPVYRNDPAASINGKPVVSFESGGMLSIGDWPSAPPSIDLNSNPGVLTTYEQTMFFAFRTANNVTDRQVIWEEGGSNRGFKILIANGEILIGAYDDILDGGDPGTGTVPKFGFTFKKLPVEANTTYVLSFVYNVPKGAHGNVLITNSSNPAPSIYTGLSGTLNGTSFPINMNTGCCQADGVGGVFTHPDPIGIGGVNRTSYDEGGPMGTGETGTELFKGRLAEICYYAYAMNETQRIIVENYLAAKYFANVIANDKYEYEANYGDGVIGIGRKQAGIEHYISQGDNIFEISVPVSSVAVNPFNGANQYLHIGHNNGSLAWTVQNVPDTSSIQRLNRVWRADRNGPNPSHENVKLKISQGDYNDLPALPAGFTKYGVLIENQSVYTPNFNLSNSTIYELHGDGVGPDSAVVVIDDGAFFTICAIKPAVRFELYNDYAIEGNPAPATTAKYAKLILNYAPDDFSASATVDYAFIDGTATNGTDYNGIAGTASFFPGQQETYIPFNIVNNLTVDPPPSKDFDIALSNPSAGLTIGDISTFGYSIYDDDPDPKITFTTDSSEVNESSGTAELTVQVIGTTTASTTVRIRRNHISVAGTATYNEDYFLPDADGWYDGWNGSNRRFLTVIIPPGSNESVTIDFPITPTDLDEFNETIIFALYPVSGEAGTGTGSKLEHQVRIVDQDPEPEVSFTSANSEGFESISDPRIYVVLSGPSAKQIAVPYIPNHIDPGPPQTFLSGTATNESISPGGDYNMSPSGGTLIFDPGEVEKYIDILVYGGDALGEDPETIFLELEPPVYAGLSNSLPIQHTYTIKEYSEYEWLGIAGVGKVQDNTFWMVPDAGITSTDASSVPELSPRSINIFQDVASKRPEITTRANGINNRKMVVFNGTSNNLKVGGTGSLEGQSNLVNTGGFYDNKSIYFVMKPHKVNSSTPQVIYEQGGGTRGLSIYIRNNKLYFYIWNDNNDGAHSPWGITGSNIGVAYIESSSTLVADEVYVVSCHYSRNWSSPAEPGYVPAGMGGMQMYINGELVGSYTGNCGRLYTHGGRASIGSAWHQTRFQHTSAYPASGTSDMDNWYEGELGEFLYYNEPRMNEARVRIIHNYLSSQFNIPLVNSAQDFNLDYADNLTSTLPDFNYQMAGIGHIGSVFHADSQGDSELRVSDPVFANLTDFAVWGNNGENLTTTWPYSNTSLPPLIDERSGKVWRFNNPGNGVTTVDIAIRYSDSDNSSAFMSDNTLLKLLYHNESDPQDFSSATVVNGTNLPGEIALFQDVPITDGMYITLGNTSNYFNTPLPIELLSFDAILNHGQVDLNWITSTEVNNEYFLVERAGSDLEWKELMSVPGAGNSTSAQYYYQIDRAPLQGISYYRLKQVDYDGAYTYSDIVSVQNNLNKLNEVLLYPNPNNAEIVNIVVPLNNIGLTTVTMTDVTGKVLFQKSDAIEQSQIVLDYGSVPAGVYLINIKSNSINETKKLIVE